MGGGQPTISPNGEITGSLEKAATGSDRWRSFWRTRNIKIDSGYAFSYKDGEELKGEFNLSTCTPAKLVSGQEKQFEFDELPLTNDRKGWFKTNNHREALAWIKAINMTTGIGGVEMVVKKSDPSYQDPAFKDDDGNPTGIRVPDGTNVIAFKGKKRWKVQGQGDVEYTHVSHEGNLGYIATANIISAATASPGAASEEEGNQTLVLPGQVAAWTPEGVHKTYGIMYGDL